jgi:hypothetical protein
MFKWVMRAYFRHLRFKSFPIIQRTSRAIEFWPLQSLFEVSGVHRDSISQSGSCLGSVRVHSLTLSNIPGSMWCDSRASSCLNSRASFLARTLAIPFTLVASPKLGLRQLVCFVHDSLVSYWSCVLIKSVFMFDCLCHYLLALLLHESIN